MAILIGLEKVSLEWPGKPVLKDVTAALFEGDRIGIVGKNGDGKTSLLRLIDKQIEPDSGTVTWRNNIAVDILSQHDALDDNHTLIQAIFGEKPTYAWAADPAIRELLGALLGDLDLERTVGTLSGGQRRRVDLARVLAGQWDVLLLDEPTNHLDMRAIRWLANHLKRRWRQGEGALACITHDRWFLDEISTSMWEVHDQTIESYEGGYSAYIQQRVERARLARVKEERRQNTLKKELAWLARGAQARTSKPKFRIKEARALIADEPPLRNELELKRMAVSRLGKQVFELKDVTFAYEDGLPVINSLDWLIGPGERIGILGANGEGKSTLLKLFLGELEPTSGTIKRGASVKMAYLSQHLDVLEDKQDWTVLELVQSYKNHVMIGGRDYTPSALLESLGFDTRETTTRVGALSGGQKRRVALMCVLLEEPNVLILDEPGNDLDTDMLAVMEDLLDEWPGTMLLVTHDRYLIERVTDDLYALQGGILTHVPGGVDQFLNQLERRTSNEVAALPETTKAPERASQALSNAERRDLKRRFGALDRKLKKLADEPARLEAELMSHDPTDYVGLTQIQDQIARAKDEQSALEDEWLELADRLGEL